jgi:hypothetical protein
MSGIRKFGVRSWESGDEVDAQRQGEHKKYSSDEEECDFAVLYPATKDIK